MLAATLTMNTNQTSTAASNNNNTNNINNNNNRTTNNNNRTTTTTTQQQQQSFCKQHEDMISKIVCFLMVTGNVILLVMAVRGKFGKWSEFFIGAPFILIVLTSFISLILSRRRRAALLFARGQLTREGLLFGVDDVGSEEDDEELKEEILRILFPGNRMDEESAAAYKAANSKKEAGKGEDDEEDEANKDGEEGSDTEDGGVACAICLEPIVSGDLIVSGPSCDHVFHRACVFQWLMKKKRGGRRRGNNQASSDHNTCPTCRSPMWTGEEYENAETEARIHTDKVLQKEDGENVNNNNTNNEE